MQDLAANLGIKIDARIVIKRRNLVRYGSQIVVLVVLLY